MPKPETKNSPETIEAPTSPLSDLRADVKKDLQNPDRLGQAIEKLFEAFGGAVDKILAVLGLSGVNTDSDSVEASFRKPPEDFTTENSENEKASANEKKSGTVQKYAGKLRASLERIYDKFAEANEWLGPINETIQKYNLPMSPGTFLTFIHKESGGNTYSVNGVGARGLAQAMPGTFKEYLAYKRSRGEAVRVSAESQKEMDARNAKIKNGALKLNEANDPKVAIDFMGWFFKTQIAKVNTLVSKGGWPESFKINGSDDIKYLYMVYNNGPRGYLVLRRYLENPTQQNFAKLEYFQKRRTKNGELEGIARARYADSVAEAAASMEAIHRRKSQAIA